MPHPLVAEPAVPTINREAQVQEATQRLDKMLSDVAVIDSVLFFYGVPTVGKTTLLHEIRRQCARRGVPTALVDFDPASASTGQTEPQEGNWYAGPQGKVRVVERLTSDLARTSQYASESSTGVEAATATEQDADTAADRLLDFAQRIYQFRHRVPFALFFDTLEFVDLETLQWIQRHVLVPFLHKFHTLIVMAGRREPNVADNDLVYAIERRMKKIHLEPFDQEQTAEQIRVIGAADRGVESDRLTRFTGGLPGLNDKVIRWWVEEAPQSEDDLRSRLVKEVIFKRYLLPTLTAAEQAKRQEEILAVSPLRQFDLGLLRRVARLRWGEQYPEKEVRPVRTLLMALQATRLVEPHPDGYGYAIPNDLRLTLDTFYRQTHEIDHLRTHSIAAHYFSEQVVQGDIVSIVNRLYHLGGVWADLDVNPDLRGEVGADLLPGDNRMDRLTQELVAALEQLRASQLPDRVFDLADKINRTLKQREFGLMLGIGPANTLADICEKFKNNLR